MKSITSVIGRLIKGGALAIAIAIATTATTLAR